MRTYIYSLFIGISLSTPFVVGAADTSCPSFIHTQETLKLGSRGASVISLQQFLKSETTPTLPTTGTFGKMTRTALMSYQKTHQAALNTIGKYTIGTLDQTTRTHIEKQCTPQKTASAATTAPTIVSIPLSSKSIPGEVLRIPFTQFSITAPAHEISLSAVTVERTGLGSDGAFESVVLLDADGAVISDEKRLNSLHTAHIPVDITIPAHETQTFTLAANIGEVDDYTGQMPSFTIRAIDATTPITGLPIVGTAHTLVSGISVGSLTFARGIDDPFDNGTLYINDTGITFSSIRVTAGSAEPLMLTHVAWEQNGSASFQDIENIQVIVNNTSYPTERDGKEYEASFGQGIRIEKGMNATITVKGDIRSSGSGRTVRFDIAGADDVGARGLQYGYYVEGSPESHTATSGNSVFLTSDGTPDGESLDPFYKGSEFTISPGAFINITK